MNIDKYWLLDQETMNELGSFLSMQKNRVNVCNNLVNVDNNPVNVDNNSQRESKREIDIDKKDKSIYGVPEMHSLTKFLIDRKYIKENDCEIILYNKVFEEAISKYRYYDVVLVVRYIVSYSLNADPKIDNKFSFMKASVFNNLEQYNIQHGGVSFEKWIESRFL